MEVATLGGGCFWCTEAVLEQVEGVESVVSGYAGGMQLNPNYDEVCSGNTGHAEVVQVTFDPGVISFREILEIIFAIHDPTSFNQQGNDIGTQYRSVIFHLTLEQKRIADALIAQLERRQLWGGPIVTEVVRAPSLYHAEDYHQQYFRHHPGQGYCLYVVAPKVAEFRQRYLSRLKR